MKKGMLFVLSGPSGVGKGTVKGILLGRNDNIIESISCTTREPRMGEIEGASYFFKSEEEFMELVENNMFIEECGVFGKRYGTLRAFVDDKLNEGLDVLLEIDVQGALKVKNAMPDCVLIMLAPPSLDVLLGRLKGRGTETAEQIEMRFSKAKTELKECPKFDFVVINDKLNLACDRVESIMESEQLRVHRNSELIEGLIDTIE